MAHSINFIGINSEQKKLENLAYIINESVNNFFPFDMKIYAESDLFSISLGLSELSISISTFESIQFLQDTIIDYFHEEGISYFIGEEFYW